MVRHQVSLSGSGPNSVQKVDNVIPHRINLYPLDGDLSSGRRYQMFQQSAQVYWLYTPTSDFWWGTGNQYYALSSLYYKDLAFLENPFIIQPAPRYHLMADNALWTYGKTTTQGKVFQTIVCTKPRLDTSPYARVSWQGRKRRREVIEFTWNFRSFLYSSLLLVT